MSKPFRSKPENAVLDPHAFAPLDDDWEYTAIPVLDRSEVLSDGVTPICFQGTQADGFVALERLGLEPLTADDVEHLHALAQIGEAIELPAFVGTPIAETTLEARRISDEANRAAMLRLGWTPGRAVANFGKGWIAGAPPGRAWLMGWWVKDVGKYGNDIHGPGFIQPRPLPGSKGRHGANDQADDGTNLWGKRRRARTDRAPDTDPAPTGGEAWAKAVLAPITGFGAAVGAALDSLLKDEPMTPAPTASTPLEGIDVSGHQPVVDFKRVRAAGISFVYVKATEGVSFTDKKAASHGKGARDAGLELGAYHYLRVRRGAQDAAKQAGEFLRVYRAIGCTLIPAIDVETDGNEGRTHAEYLEAVRQARVVLEDALGMAPFIYTYPGFWAGAGALRAANDLAACPLWIASYTKRGPTIPPPWTAATMWQYAAGKGVLGTVDGVPGYVDRNRLFVGLDFIRAR